MPMPKLNEETRNAWLWLEAHAHDPRVWRDLGDLLHNVMADDPSSYEELGRWVTDAFVTFHTDTLAAKDAMLSALTGCAMADLVRQMAEDYE